MIIACSFGLSNGAWNPGKHRHAHVQALLTFTQEAPTNNRGGVATSSSRQGHQSTKLKQRPNRRVLTSPTSNRGERDGEENVADEVVRWLEESLRASPEMLRPACTLSNKDWPKDRSEDDPIQDLARQISIGNRTPEHVLSKVTLTKDLQRVLVQLVRNKQEDKALQVLEWAEKQPRFRDRRAILHSTMVSLLAGTSMGAVRVLALHQRLKSGNVPLDLLTYNTILVATGRARMWNQTQEVFKEMLTVGERPDVFTYTCLIKACQACGNRWKQGLQYLTRMQAEGVEPNVATFTTLMSCCYQAGKWEKAMHIFRDMEKAGVRPDVKAYNTLISACARGGRWEHAWDVCSSMRRAGCHPNTRTYNALISACAKARQPQRALEAYRKMQREAATGRKLEPTRVTYNTLISACAKGGMYDAALEVFESLKRQGHSPDAYTLSALIRACKAVNYWEEALEFVEEFRNEHGVKLNTVACNALLATLGTAGRWQYAKQFFDQLAAGELEGRPDSWSYSAMALAFRRGDQFTLVLDTYQEMLQRNMPVYHDVYYGVLESCERLGLWQEGRDTLRQMQEGASANRILDSSLDMAAWQAVFAFPTMMESVPKQLISAARAAVDTGKYARRLVSTPRHRERGGRAPDEFSG